MDRTTVSVDPVGDDGDAVPPRPGVHRLLLHGLAEDDDLGRGLHHPAGDGSHGPGVEGRLADGAEGDGDLRVEVLHPVDELRSLAARAQPRGRDERRGGHGDDHVGRGQAPEDPAGRGVEAAVVEGSVGEGALAEGGRGDADDVDAAPGRAGRVPVAAEVVAAARDDGDLVTHPDEVLRQVGRHLPGGGEVGGEELVEEEDSHFLQAWITERLAPRSP